MNTKSFTLIEILIVVLTISVLSSIIYVASNGARERGEFGKILMFSEKLSSSLAENLVAQWDFNEGTGSSVSDASLNANTGTITGATWETVKANCISGTCLNFNGSNQYVQKASPSGLPSGQSARTISAWIYPNNVNPGGAIVALNDSTAVSQSFIFQLGFVSPSTYLFTDGKNSSNNITVSGTEIPLVGKWSNVVFIFDGGSGWKYYLNGELKKQGTFTVQINTVVNNLSVGRRGDGGNTGSYWPGRIDQVAIFDRAVSVYNIQEVYLYGLSNLLINSQISKQEYSERIKLAENE